MENQIDTTEKQESHDSISMDSGLESADFMTTMVPPPLQLSASDGFPTPPPSNGGTEGLTVDSHDDDAVAQLTAAAGQGEVMQLLKVTDLSEAQKEHAPSKKFAIYLIKTKMDLKPILGIEKSVSPGSIQTAIGGILAEPEGDLPDSIIPALGDFIQSQNSQPEPAGREEGNPFGSSGGGMARETAPIPASRTIEEGPNLIQTNIPSGINGFFDLVIDRSQNAVTAIVKIQLRGTVGDEQRAALHQVEQFWNANVRFQHQKTFKIVKMNLKILEFVPDQLDSPHYKLEFLDSNETNASVQRNQQQILIRTPKKDQELGNQQPSAFHEFGHAFGLHEEYGLDENLKDPTHHQHMWPKGADELRSLTNPGGKEQARTEDPNSIMGTGMHIFPRHFAPLLQQYCALAGAGPADDWNILIHEAPEIIPDSGNDHPGSSSGRDDSRGGSPDKDGGPDDKSHEGKGKHPGMGKKESGGLEPEGKEGAPHDGTTLQESETTEFPHNGEELVTTDGTFRVDDERSGSPGNSSCFWDSLRILGIDDEALQAAALDSGVTHNDWFDDAHLQTFINSLSTLLRRPITLNLYRATYTGGNAIMETMQGVPQLDEGVQAEPDVTYALAIFSIADQQQGHFIPPQ